jgi:uncharacterized protein YeaO (DUF488 family)
VIHVKSAYDPPSKSDGYRILVVRNWPVGMPRGKASGCEWIKSLGPTESLLGWMRKNPRKIGQFVDKYLAELGKNDAAVDKVRAMHERFGAVTVLSVPAVDEHWPIADTLARFLAATCDIV